MNPHTIKRLSEVHPLLRRRVEIIIARLAEQGITLEVVQGFRTAQEQNDLYAQGRSKPGHRVTNAKAWQSYHNYGIAADLCPFVDGKPDWNAPRSVWNAIGAEAERLHLEWGGRWKKRDFPHVQLPGLSISQCFDLSKAGSLKPVWDKLDRIAAEFASESPQIAPKAERVQIPIEPEKRQDGRFPAQVPAFPVSLPPDFSPRVAEDVIRPVPFRVAQALKSGNSLPVLVSTLVAVRDFLTANKLIVIAVILSILLVVVWLEFRPQKGRFQ